MNFDAAPLILSFKTALTATLIALILGVATAYWVLNCSRRVKAVLDGIFILPMVLPPTVIGFLLLLFFGKNSIVGQILAALHIQVIFSWHGAVIASSAVAFPLMYRTARGAFEQVDPNMLHAARTLGLPNSRIFIKILIPLSLPGLAAGVVLSFARALGEFGATLMIAGNIPKKTQTIPLAIYFAAEGGDISSALHYTIITLLISLASVFLLNLWNNMPHQSAVGR